MKNMSDMEAIAKYKAGFGGGMNFKNPIKHPPMPFVNGYAPETMKMLGDLVQEKSRPTPTAPFWKK